MRSTATLWSLMMPGGVLLLSAAVLVQTGWLTLAFPALSFLYYCALIGGTLLAWRFHSSRIFFALLVLFLAQQAITQLVAAHASPGTAGSTTLQATAVLVPLNFALLGLMKERGLALAAIAPIGLFVFAQSVVVAVLYLATDNLAVPRTHHVAATTITLPGYALLAFALACVSLFVRSLRGGKPVDNALLWSLLACFLSLHFAGSARLSIVYSATAAIILATSIIENSYLLAYHDELTMLPSRRAFNDALLRLEPPYSIAVVDIDHFKRFNDTHGHDTGDQVLRLVAANLSQVTGGGQAYRCGVEEFTILFPGKTTLDVVDHLEQLRAAIESSQFRMRGSDRRRVPRGPERRIPPARRRTRKGHLIRQLAEKPSAALSVTVSIGVAASTKENPYPDLVLQTADKALYRAKANGRNRIETTPAIRRSRLNAAGTA